MAGADQPGTPPIAAYGRDALRYDERTSGFEAYRRRVIDLLPLREGDVVIDVGCGTGLCFEQLVGRVGRTGTVVGVDPAAEMLALAGARVADRGWSNVVLVGSPTESAELPTADHALFCAVHDVLQSAAALDHVLAHLRDGGGVAATGGKWAPPWAVAVNAVVLGVHAPFVRDFTGFERPWALLAQRVPDLQVREVALGGGYLAWGRMDRG
ncbi:class I SAM-dependent methyltransferase [Modestobacter marinus]|uniref:class I SAM-dependent methyltransferase n=1 Tax=Modestobacter marinus TaxID=477641 RepID=UPI001C93F861|nr:methyltransferase domain-containing protein [Modestobacter marinus]